jgi:hypothetical protein
MLGHLCFLGSLPCVKRKKGYFYLHFNQFPRMVLRGIGILMYRNPKDVIRFDTLFCFEWCCEELTLCSRIIMRIIQLNTYGFTESSYPIMISYSCLQRTNLSLCSSKADSGSAVLTISSCCIYNVHLFHESKSVTGIV